MRGKRWRNLYAQRSRSSIGKKVEPNEGDTLYDPTCGSGGMLLEAVHYMRRNGLNTNKLSLFGQEKISTLGPFVKCPCFYTTLMMHL